ASGWKKFVLAERIINITGSFQLENYTVTATYDVYTGQQSVNMSGNQEITITLPFILPEFPVFLLLPAFITSTLAAVLIFKKKRVRV
ncbi:MAG: hypothetical protein QXZ70_04525, partial [Candidatus Bathyarchaeia archaeon]